MTMPPAFSGPALVKLMDPAVMGFGPPPVTDPVKTPTRGALFNTSIPPPLIKLFACIEMPARPLVVTLPAELTVPEAAKILIDEALISCVVISVALLMRSAPIFVVVPIAEEAVIFPVPAVRVRFCVPAVVPSMVLVKLIFPIIGV